MAKKQVKKTAKKAPTKKVKKQEFMLANPTMEDIENLDLPEDVKKALQKSLAPLLNRKKGTTVIAQTEEVMLHVNGATCESGCCANISVSRKDGKPITVDQTVDALLRAADDMMARYEPEQELKEVTGAKPKQPETTSSAH